MNIYLDIDGVLLREDGRAADFADEFLQFILANWPDTIHWLSIRNREGREHIIETLRPHLKAKTLKQIQNIKLTTWEDLKTDAIYFKRPFLWYDTNLYPEEEEILEHYQALPCFRRITLRKIPMQLLDEIVYLRSLA